MKWVFWCTVRGLPSPETSILFENWLFAIGRGIIMDCSNTCYPQVCRIINYPRRPNRALIVRPRPYMACPSNRTQRTIAKTFIPTNRCETISPVGVNSISPPSGNGWGCSHSMGDIVSHLIVGMKVLAVIRGVRFEGQAMHGLGLTIDARLGLLG